MTPQATTIRPFRLVQKADIRFLLKMFGLDGGYIRFTTGRCDHNSMKHDIGYVEFLKTMQETDFPATEFSSTVGPCPRSPHRNIRITRTQALNEDTLAALDG